MCQELMYTRGRLQKPVFSCPPAKTFCHWLETYSSIAPAGSLRRCAVSLGFLRMR